MPAVRATVTLSCTRQRSETYFFFDNDSKTMLAGFDLLFLLRKAAITRGASRRGFHLRLYTTL